MNSALIRAVCRLLIASLLLLPFHGVQAGMIGTDRVATAGLSTDRDTVRNFLLRSDVASQLRSMGVDQLDALERVAAMTDSEVRTLAGNVDSLPAGAGALYFIILAALVYLIYRFARSG